MTPVSLGRVSRGVSAFVLLLSIVVGSFPAFQVQAATTSALAQASQTTVIGLGSTGGDVLLFQAVLYKLGYLSSAPTGYYGTQTKKAVATFQKFNSLPVTGSVDDRTRYYISRAAAQLDVKVPSVPTASPTPKFTTTSPPVPVTAPNTADTSTSVLKLSSKGAAVTDLQKSLNTLGLLDVAPTGFFGPLTETAVKTFQSSAQLPVTGQIDSGTQQTLTAAVNSPTPVQTPPVTDAGTTSSVTLSFSTSATSVAIGNQFTLRWEASRATSCVASDNWSGARKTKGTEIVTARTEGTKKFVLTCSGSTGSKMETLTVVVVSSTPTPTPLPVPNPDPTPAPTPTPTPTLSGVVSEGDSISVFWGGNHTGIYASANPTVIFTSFAAGGASISDTLGGNGLIQRQSKVLNAHPKVFTVLIGANDLTSYSSASAWANALFGYLAPIKATGAKIAVATILPQQVSTQQANNVLHNTRRVEANNIIRAAVGTKIDAVIDFAADPVMGPDSAASNTTLYKDGLHPTDGAAGGVGGQGRLALIYTPVVNALLAGAPAPTPTPTPSVAPTLTFTASPTSVVSGASSNLVWSSTNATSCTGVGQGIAGTQPVSASITVDRLTSSQHFVLTCTGTGGSVTKSVDVTVTPTPTPLPAPTLTFSGNPTSVVSGGATDLTWSAGNATSCLGVGKSFADTQPTSGKVNITNITSNATFTLTCTGAGGSVTKAVSVTVTAPPTPTPSVAPTLTFTASPTSVASGGSATLAWSADNATSCTGTGQGIAGVQPVSKTIAVTNITADLALSLTCTGAGGSVTKSVTITVPAPATVPPPTSSVELPSIASNFDINSELVPSWGTGAIPASAAPDVVGAFRFICNASHESYDDPIVYPGQPGASHLHEFFGNTLTNANSTYQSLRTSGMSTCNSPLNRSAYWIPAMINGAGQVVRPDFVSVYYKRRPATDPLCQKIGTACVNLPRGLRFVFGANLLSATPTTGSGYFNCTGPSAVSGHYPDIATAAKNCPAGNQIGAVISAPECWDGKNLDSADHRSHVAYSQYIGQSYAQCPPTHPYVIPTFTLGIWYSVDTTLDRSGTWNPSVPTWHLASDFKMVNGVMTPLNPGSTFHSDWFGAWDDTVKSMWENGCINNLLNCSGGDLGNGKQLKMYSGFTWKANPRTVPIPSGGPWPLAYIPSQNIKVGETGPKITALQNLLKNLGFYKEQTTGYFGALTQAALAQYQNSLAAVGSMNMDHDMR